MSLLLRVFDLYPLLTKEPQAVKDPEPQAGADVSRFEEAPNMRHSNLAV